MAAWDSLKPGAWLRARGGVTRRRRVDHARLRGQVRLAAASFLLHGLDSRGSAISYRIEGATTACPVNSPSVERNRRQYGAPAAGVKQDDRGVNDAIAVQAESDGLGKRCAPIASCARSRSPVIGRIFRRSARLSDAEARAIREQYCRAR